MAIFRQPPVIFIHIRKTGGTSIRRALGLDTVTLGWHRTLKGYAKQLGDEFVNFKSFAFVRNPWDRLVSQYHHLRQSPDAYPQRWGADEMGFKDWVMSAKPKWHYPRTTVKKRKNQPKKLNGLGIAMRPQAAYLTMNGKIACTHVGRFENLHADLWRIADILGLTLNERLLPILNASDHPPYHDCYDDELAAHVGRLYKWDCKEFGYSWGQTSTTSSV